MSYTPNYIIKKYRPRDLSKRQIAFCEAYLAGYSASESLRMAGYKSDTHSTILNCKRIKEYLNKREGQFVRVPVTFESKVERLKHVVDEAIPLDKPLSKLADTGIKAIQELNKMQGHYAPTKNLNVNVEAEADKEQAKELFAKLLAKHESEY